MPMVDTLLACDLATVDMTTRRVSVVNIIDTIFAVRVPAAATRLSVVARILDVEGGEHHTETRIVSPSGERVAVVNNRFGDVQSPHYVIANFAWIPISAFGDYRIEFRMARTLGALATTEPLAATVLKAQPGVPPGYAPSPPVIEGRGGEQASAANE